MMNSRNESNSTSACPCCGSIISSLDLILDEGTGVVSYRNNAERFTPSQFRLLKALVDSYPRILTKDQCLDALVGEGDDIPFKKIVDVQICKMRKQADKLGLAITTSWGIGYRLELAEDVKSEVMRTKRFNEGRYVKGSIDAGDLSAIEMLRVQGYPLTDIARRLKLTFKAVSTAIDLIEAKKNKITFRAA